MKLRSVAAAAGLAFAAACTPAAASPASTSAKTAAAQAPVLTCGPTSTAGIWGCWNNIVGKYVLTFPSTMWCPSDDSCTANYQGAIDRWDIRHDTP